MKYVFSFCMDSRVSNRPREHSFHIVNGVVRVVKVCPRLKAALWLAPTAAPYTLKRNLEAEMGKFTLIIFFLYNLGQRVFVLHRWKTSKRYTTERREWSALFKCGPTSPWALHYGSIVMCKASPNGVSESRLRIHVSLYPMIIRAVCCQDILLIRTSLI